MSNPYRNALAELVRRWYAASGDQDLGDVADAMDQARALLAQPEPPELTDQEIAEPLALADRIAPLEREPGNDSAPDCPIWAPLGWAPPHP